MEKALLFTFIGFGLGSIFGLVGLILVITFNATKVIVMTDPTPPKGDD